MAATTYIMKSIMSFALLWIYKTECASVQSTQFNDNIADLSHDVSGVSSCSQTGFETNPHLVVDLGSTQNVSKVAIAGHNSLPNLYVRVGDTATGQEPRVSLPRNDLCRAYSGAVSISGGSLVVPCGQTMRGRFVSINTIVPAQTNPLKLTVCDVQVIA